MEPDDSEIGCDVEAFVRNLESRMPDWSEQLQIFCGALRLSESLEHDQQVVLDPARICLVGFEKAPEWFDAVLGANQMDNAMFFSRSSHAHLFSCNRIGIRVDLFENVQYRLKLPIHFRHGPI